MGFRSSIGTNGVTRHSTGTLLVKCISLRALIFLMARLSTVEFRVQSSIGTNGVTWYSTGTLLVKCISLRALRIFF